MRWIRKRRDGGRLLQRANEHPPRTAADAKSRWSNLDKQLLSDALTLDQYGLCGYTELDDSRLAVGTHIEHVVPKSASPQLTFDYANLLLCALSSAELQRYAKADQFGGHHKGSDYDPQLFVSPLMEGCDHYFIYASSGRVEPRSTLSAQQQAQARYTIDLLNLNAPLLVHERQQWIDELETLIAKAIDADSSLHNLAEVDLLPRNGRLSPFFTASRQRYGHLAETLLQQQAPELL